jgi:hypothetical protein
VGGGGRGASDGPEVGWGSHEDLLQREARGGDARGRRWNGRCGGWRLEKKERRDPASGDHQASGGGDFGR